MSIYWFVIWKVSPDEGQGFKCIICESTSKEREREKVKERQRVENVRKRDRRENGGQEKWWLEVMHHNSVPSLVPPVEWHWRVRLRKEMCERIEWEREREKRILKKEKEGKTVHARKGSERWKNHDLIIDTTIISSWLNQ